jgi:hypothetical protein
MPFVLMLVGLVSITLSLFKNLVLRYHVCGLLEKSRKYARKNLASSSKSASKPSISCVRTACPKLSTSMQEQLVVKYYLQHERPCCIGYTNSNRRREFVYPIQHGREKNDSSYEFIGEVILKIYVV